MKVYTFEDKTFQQRIDEFNLVLDDASEGASIRDEWKDFLNVTIEPAYYKAIWKISRNMCEALGIRYPTEVFGEVISTDFDELAVEFRVEQVQDEEIQLPEVCQVPLEDIYPTLFQEHHTLNVDTTADNLDRYRFFFNYIFLPFDADENFAAKSLIPRVKLFYDLKNKQLSKAMSSYIRQIVAEVKVIQFKRDLLNSSIEEEDEDEKRAKRDSKETIAKLLDLHLRMNTIKQEFEIILINPEMRDAYELIKFGRRSESSKQTFLLTTSATIAEQVQLLEQLKERISSHTTVNWVTSLTDTVARATPESEIFIPNGKYAFNFMDYLNGNVLMCGMSKARLDTVIVEKMAGNYVSISADKDSSFLFVIDGDMRFENLVIDCTSHVKTAFLVKCGKVVLKNCLVIGSSQSSVTEAFNVSGESHLILCDCIVSNFSTAINISDTSKLQLHNCTIENSVFIMGDAVKVSLESSSIRDKEGITIKYSEKLKTGFKELKLADKNELQEYGLSISDGSETSVKVISKLLEDDDEIDVACGEVEEEEQGDVSMEN